MESSLFNELETRGRKIFLPPINNTTAHVESKQIHIAATDDVRIVLEAVSHWPDGFTLNLALFVTTETQEIPHLLHHPLSTPPALDGPALAVQFADGRKTTTLDPLEYDRNIGAMVTLNITSNIGSGHTSLRQGVYVHPLPPLGPVTVAVRWQALGVAEASIKLDGAEIRANAAKAQRVWD